MEQRFRNNDNSEWGAYPAKTMCEETRSFPIELLDGKKRTLGELYDQTPKEFISKVMLEEKVFKTWYHKRFVLMGDGEHFPQLFKLPLTYISCFGVHRLIFLASCFP